MSTRKPRLVDRILWNRGGETVDEIVVHNCTVHLEQMTDTSYWIGIYKEGNIHKTIHVNLSHRGRCPLLCTAFDESDEPWVWGQDTEHE